MPNTIVEKKLLLGNRKLFNSIEIEEEIDEGDGIYSKRALLKMYIKEKLFVCLKILLFTISISIIIGIFILIYLVN